MIDPIFWLGLSILLVAVSITAVLMAAVPAFRELSRAARSAEKLFDTLNRELPPTLEAIRLTGLEISDLTDDMSQGVQSAGQVVKQVDQSLTGVKQQVQKAQITTRTMFAGVRAAWRSLSQSSASKTRGVARSVSTQNSVGAGEQRRDFGIPSQNQTRLSHPEISSNAEPRAFDSLEDDDEESAHHEAKNAPPYNGLEKPTQSSKEPGVRRDR